MTANQTVNHRRCRLLPRVSAAGAMRSTFRAFPWVMAACAGAATSWGWTAVAHAGQPPSHEALHAPAGPVQAMPIRAITLYRSGVGLFERRGTVQGDATVSLRFATDQVNDILKTMIVLDLDGGRVESVSYGSRDPLERRLASFAVNISDNPSLAALLNRLRGTPLRAVTAEGPVAGTILGVEVRPVPGGKEGQELRLPFLNLVTETGVRSLDISRLASFELLDRTLAEELNRALAALAEHRADRVKTVDIVLSGDGQRQVVVAYVHEMPVWKTSYRLVLPDPAETEAARNAGPLIQGWAIVENTTDEDWQEVRLALVAGRPVSFRMDLYEPLFIDRPEVPVPLVAAARPRLYEGGAVPGEIALVQADVGGDRAAAPEKADASFGIPAAPREAPARRRGRAGERESPFREEQRLLEADAFGRYAAAAVAQAGEIGEVFQYQLTAPVSVPRQRSAMLPILSQNIEARRVSIYSRSDGGAHAMRGVELHNTTGLQLMPGPISVFDGVAYAGDAQIGHVPIGDKRLLAYAVDLDLTAVTAEENITDLRRIRIVRGLLEQTFKQQNRVSYTFTSKDRKRPRVLIVEHPRLENWDLIEPAKPAEATSGFYRFEVPIEPGGTGRLNVVQERTQMQMLAVADFDLTQLTVLSRQGKVSPKVAEAIQRAAGMQAGIADTRRRIADLDKERDDIDRDQARIRQNMGSVSRDTDIYRRYLARLSEQESRLEAIRDERARLQGELNRQQAELDAFLRDLTVE